MTALILTALACLALGYVAGSIGTAYYKRTELAELKARLAAADFANNAAIRAQEGYVEATAKLVDQRRQEKFLVGTPKPNRFGLN